MSTNISPTSGHQATTQVIVNISLWSELGWGATAWVRRSNHHPYHLQEWCPSDGIRHPNNTIEDGVLVLRDPEQALRCQERAVVGQISLCHHPRKHSSTSPASTRSGVRQKLYMSAQSLSFLKPARAIQIWRFYVPYGLLFSFSYSVLCDTEYHCCEEPAKLPLGTWLSLETDCNLNMFPNEQEIFGDGTEEFVWQKETALTLCFKAAREGSVSWGC